MKINYILLSIMMVFSGAFIVSCDKKQQTSIRQVTANEIGREVICPVTKNKFTVVAQTKAIDYEGETYYFCCPGCDNKFTKEPHKYIHQKSKNDKQEKQTYHCPMHPNYVSDKPGNCPICNMSLVPVEEEHPTTGQHSEGIHGREPVNITSEKQQLIGVRTSNVKRKNVTKTIRTVGRVAYDPELYYAGQEYITSIKRYEQLKTNISENAEKDRLKMLLDSAKFRLKLLGLSEEQINELATKDEPDASLLITEGSQTAWIYAQVYEYDLGFIKRGQEVKITLPYNTSEIFAGKVIAIDPVLNPDTRSVRVRILTNNTSGILKPEVYVNVEIKAFIGNFLTIPADAVLDTGTRQVVFIDKGNGLFEPREVVLGEKIDEDYILKSGILEHEKVVTSANFLIDSESQLKSALKQMAGGHKH